MAVEDITNLVERLEAFEDRLGVRIEALSADFNYDADDGEATLTVRGELHPQSGTELQQDVELVVAAYDSSSRIVGTESHYFEMAGFFGLEVFEIVTFVHVKNLSRIRVYPKRQG